MNERPSVIPTKIIPQHLLQRIDGTFIDPSETSVSAVII